MNMLRCCSFLCFQLKAGYRYSPTKRPGCISLLHFHQGVSSGVVVGSGVGSVVGGGVEVGVGTIVGVGDGEGEGDGEGGVFDR